MWGNLRQVSSFCPKLPPISIEFCSKAVRKINREKCYELDSFYECDSLWTSSHALQHEQQSSGKHGCCGTWEPAHGYECDDVYTLCIQV